MKEFYKNYLLNRMESIFRSYNYRTHSNKNEIPVVVTIDRRLICAEDKIDIITRIKEIASKIGHVKKEHIFVHLSYREDTNASVFINIRNRGEKAKIKYTIKQSDIDFGYNINENYNRRKEREVDM